MHARAKITAKTPESKRENSVSRTGKTDFSQSISSPIDNILFLQRTIGNQAVQRLFESGAIQAKLKIGQPNDKYEQEADRVAEQVMSMPELQVQRQPEEEEEEEEIQAKPISEQITPLVQRQAEEEEEEEEELFQTKEVPGQAPEVTPDLESRIHSLKGYGQPLPKSVRAFFEPRFGYDFSQVRIHTDGGAAETARALNAQAFTTERDVVFGSSQYSPDTTAGKKLLAHELTHVVQQSDNFFQPRPMIQCWGPSVHEGLTEKGVKQIFSGYPSFKMNREALSKLTSYSTAMDFKLPALWFNLKATLYPEFEREAAVGYRYPGTVEKIDIKS